MLNEKPVLKIGDWVKTKARDGELVIGYIESLDILKGLAKIVVVTSDREEAVGTIIEAEVAAVEELPAVRVKNKEQIHFLIDLALMTGDEEWFLELSSQLNSMKELVKGTK